MGPMTSIGAGLALVFGALLVMAVAYASADGKLSRNVAVGLRTNQTMKSDAAWLQSHREVAPLLKTSSWVVIGIALVTVATGLPGSFRTVSLVAFLLGSAVLVGSVILAGVRAHFVARGF